MPKISESIYNCGGATNELDGPKPNEDYFTLKSLAPDVLFIAIADGMGAKPSTLQPAAIACTKAAETITRLYEFDSDAFFSHPDMMLSEALHMANNVIGSFKIANEEMHAGFAVSLTCLLIYDETKISYAHCGNCRINLIRAMGDDKPKIIQLTNDHTEAAQLLNDGEISLDEYYMHPGKFVYTSCIGKVNNPEMQLYNGKIKKGDVLLLTTDGIHYSIHPDYLTQIILESVGWRGASENLIQGARQEKVGDNATAIIFISSID